MTIKIFYFFWMRYGGLTAQRVHCWIGRKFPVRLAGINYCHSYEGHCICIYHAFSIIYVTCSNAHSKTTFVDWNLFR